MNQYKKCTRCIMDEKVPLITFDESGVCNFCTDALIKVRAHEELVLNSREELENLVKKIKASKKGSGKYDCIIGLSGGVDSSYVAHLVKKHSLNPLAIHLDNGWNSDLAVTNIEKLVKSLDIDLFTYVINWNEFKDLQLSFLKSNVANCEIPTDHAIFAILFKMANKYGIKYIIHGGNSSSESIMPRSWMEDAFDMEIIKSVHRKYGTVKLKTFPRLGYPRLFYNLIIKRVKYIGILNYLDYNKETAITVLENELGWTRYSGKHFESIFTRWFQGHYLVQKYNIDKRLAHYSSLIISKQLSREDALEKMKELPYDQATIDMDNNYIRKKFDLTEQEFNDMMQKKNADYKYFSIYQWFLRVFKDLITKIKKFAS
jgi:N-acetyl sugar amidotransferase